MSRTSDEISREKMETEHWRLGCLVLKHHNNELRMECSQLKEKYEEKKGIEVSRKHDEANVIVYKRRKYAEDILENQQQSVKTKRDIDDFKLGKKRDAAEIEHLKMKCKELETVSLKHEIELGKELEAYKIKCEGLSVEIELKGSELEKLMVVNGGLDHELQEYRSKCNGMEEEIKGLVEYGKVMSQREKSAEERIFQLGEIVKKMQTDERDRFRELETQISKLQEENATLRALKKLARKGMAWSR